MDTSKPFKWRHFQAEIILLCVRWLCWLLGTSVREIHHFLRTDVPFITQQYTASD